jgi:hypothetical protein
VRDLVPVVGDVLKHLADAGRHEVGDVASGDGPIDALALVIGLFREP